MFIISVSILSFCSYPNDHFYCVLFSSNAATTKPIIQWKVYLIVAPFLDLCHCYIPRRFDAPDHFINFPRLYLLSLLQMTSAATATFRLVSPMDTCAGQRARILMAAASVSDYQCQTVESLRPFLLGMDALIS